MVLPARLGSALDLCIAAGYALLVWGLLTHELGPGPVAVAGTLLTSLALALRRRRPPVAFAAALGAFWLTPVDPVLATVALVPMAAVLYTVAASRDVRSAAFTLALALTGPLATAVPDFSHNGAVVPFALILVVAWAAGYALGRQREYGRVLVRHHEQSAEAESQRARARVVEERLRIARELHDIVAHSMSIVTLQAGFGHLVIDERPTDARAALSAIETTGRQALAEMRRLLGVLRDEGDEAAAIAPLPGLAGLDELVAQTERAGVKVELTISGVPGALSPGVDLTAYRILQEALTNVIKHAGGSIARVAIAHHPGELVLHVTDDGRARYAEVAVGTGHGLVGMRERVAACNGELRAGLMPSGGFEVAVRLPYEESGA